MVQRSPTYVVSIREAQKVYAIYTEGLPFEDCDLLAAASPYPCCSAPTSSRPPRCAVSIAISVGPG